MGGLGGIGLEEPVVAISEGGLGESVEGGFKAGLDIVATLVQDSKNGHQYFAGDDHISQASFGPIWCRIRMLRSSAQS